MNDQRVDLLRRLEWLDQLSNGFTATYARVPEVQARLVAYKEIPQKWPAKKRLIWSGICIAALSAMVFIGWAVYDEIAKQRLFAEAEGFVRHMSVHPLIVTVLASPITIGLGIGLGFLIVSVRNRRLPRAIANVERINRERAEHNAPVEAELRHMLHDLDRMQSDYAHARVPDWYPVSYLFEDALRFCIGMLRDHRASSVQEAVNLYEETQHRQRLEQGQQNLLEGQRRIAGMLIASTAVSTMMQQRTINAINNRPVVNHTDVKVDVHLRNR